MKKLIYKTEKSNPLFVDKDLVKEQPISEKELKQHFRKLKKLNKMYEELIKDI